MSLTNPARRSAGWRRWAPPREGLGIDEDDASRAETANRLSAEAAHAVIAWLYGFKVASVQLSTDPAKGLTTLARRDPSVTLRLISEASEISGNLVIAIFVMIRLAGIAAEMTLVDADETFGDYRSELDAGRMPADFAEISDAFHSGHGRDKLDDGGAVFAAYIGNLAALCRKHLNERWPRD